MVPGVSRSGASIVGAMLLGADKRAAAEFSSSSPCRPWRAPFTYDLLKNYKILSFDDVTLIVAGFAAAFVSALIVVNTFLAYVSRHGFTPFAWWRILVGAAGLAGLIVFG
jgi:undecaprenyl-diphosphatase